MRIRQLSTPARHPSGFDLALAAALFVLGLVEASWAIGTERPLALALIPMLTVPLAWRRLKPEAVALVVTAALVLQLPLASFRLFDQTFTGFVCVLLASYALGRHSRGRWVIPIPTGCALAVAIALGWYDDSVGTFVLGIVFMVAPAATGHVVAARSELRALLDRQADMIREYAEAEERTRVVQVRGRIAAEVQDLVSRRVNGMVERSTAASRLTQENPAWAAELVATVETDGRAALDEMRRMLNVLRSTHPAQSNSLDPAANPDDADRARSVPLRRVELLLLAVLLVLVVVETLASPDAVPAIALTMLVPLLAFASGARTSGRAAAVGLALAFVAVTVVTELVGEGGWGDYAFPAVLVALSWTGGRLVRQQNDLVDQSRSRAAALERGAQVRAAAAAAEERLRLARELHDVLSHTLMVMIIQAGAARRSLETGRAGATKALRVIEETGHDATTELRRLLALVNPDGEPNERDGTPGIDDLGSLVDRARAAGLAADLIVEGDPTPVPGGIALAAYRVAQEAVTNVIRHAQAREVHLRLRHEPGQMQLEVRDDGRPVTPPRGGTSGNGITGMRERVEMYDGQLSAGPVTGQGFVVTATFPLVDLRQEQPA